MAGSGIGPYDPELESWSTFQDRFELFFTAKGFDNSKKVAVLLTEVGREVYGTLENLLSPAKPKSKTFKDLTEALSKHYGSQTIIIAERFRFHKRMQQEGEPVMKFVEDLRRRAKSCSFGEFLEDALRDQLVCGLLNEQQQSSLLAIKELTLGSAIEKVQALEMAAAQASAMKSESAATGSGAVNAVASKKNFERKKCFRCGGEHSPNSCRFKTEKCRLCKKTGHIARVCRSQRAVNELDEDEEALIKAVRINQEIAAMERSIPHVGPMVMDLRINGTVLPMQVDTGAAVSVMSRVTYNKYFRDVKLRSTKDSLVAYGDNKLRVSGQVYVTVTHNEKTHEKMPIYVVTGGGSTLLGRDWIKKLELTVEATDFQPVQSVDTDQDVQALLNKHEKLFEDGVGELKGFQATLNLKDDAKPVFERARSVPYATRTAIEKELDRLVEQGIAYPVKHSEWATPVVPVPKPDGSVRLCGDYKVTVNPRLNVEQHPIPKPDDLFATLNGGQQFSKLDLSQAYQQCVLDEESQRVVTLVTHRGLYRLRRLPYGVASAPAIFQALMEQVLNGIEGVVVYLDDILITAPDRTTHLARLAEVMERLEEAGLKLKEAKCMFLQDQVEYLGFIVDATGLHAMPSKVEAVVNAPTPTDVTQLRSFMGLVNYYGRFVPDLATIAHPLHRLMATESWAWSTEAEDAFNMLKMKLTSPQVLVHYSPDLPIRLACDASPYGVGAVISHVMPDGEERPIAFASRTLTSSERNYSQIEREGLGIIFGVTRFHLYLYGRKFELITDNKPLAIIIGPKKGIPSIAAMRLQRWAVILAAYDYTVTIKRSTENANADGMSRLPVSAEVDVNVLDSEVNTLLTATLHRLPVAASDIATATKSDPILPQVMEKSISGWPKIVSEPLQKYYNVSQRLFV